MDRILRESDEADKYFEEWADELNNIARHYRKQGGDLERWQVVEIAMVHKFRILEAEVRELKAILNRKNK